MRTLRVAWARLRGLFAGPDADTELRAELESHLAMHIEENVRRGMDPHEARRQALIAAGGLTAAAEAARDQRGLPWLETLLADARYAARALWLNRAYSAAVILTVALGIGANAAMFTILNAVMLRPLPYPAAERLYSISLKDTQGDHGSVPEQSYIEWARSARSMSFALSNPSSALFTIGGETESVSGQCGSESYFEVKGMRPLAGRVFTRDEDMPGGNRVVVLSEQFWRRRFAGDSAIVGRVLTMSDRPTTVIGVMPARYSSEQGPHFWTPCRFAPSEAGVTYYYSVIARLRDGFTIDAARAELAALQRRVEDAPSARPPGAPAPEARTPVAMSLRDRAVGDSRRPLVLLFGAVGVLLLIACANLANLALARASRREREFVVRVALGAGRWRLARLVLVESFLLSLAGACLGLVLSIVAVRYVVQLSPSSVRGVDGIGVDARVLSFTLLVATLTAVLFGLVPARAAGRSNLVETLASGGPRASSTRRHRWARRVLVVGQLATALMLITGAGIVARTFWRVTSLDVGFRPENLLIVRATLPMARYPAPAAEAFNGELMERLRREPGIERVALTDAPPIGNIAMSMSETDSTGKTTPMIDVVHAGLGYLETIGAQLTAGRFIDASDRAGSQPVAVLTETAARRLFPGGSAVGRRLPIHNLLVVGVIKDIRQRGLEEPPGVTAYLARAQDEHAGLGATAFVARTSGDPMSLQAAVRRAVRSIDPRLPPPSITSMERRLSNTVAPRRFTFVLLGSFAALAGLLAVVGLYGVLAYLVADRTREIGIRIALGADVARVRRMVIAQGMSLVLLGTAIGVAGSLAAAGTLETMVYEVSVHDPRAFAAGAVLLAAVGYLACFIPARRASRVDPILALRAD